MSVIVKGGGGENVTPEVQAQNIKMDDISTTYGIPARADGTTNKEQLQSNNGWLDRAKQKMSEELLPENIPYGKTVMGIEGEFSSSSSVSANASNGAIVVYGGGGIPVTNCMLEGYGAFINGEEVVGSLPAQAYEITSVAIDADIVLNELSIQDTYTNLASIVGVYGGGRNYLNNPRRDSIAFIAGASGFIEFFVEGPADLERDFKTISALFDGGVVGFDVISASGSPGLYPSTLEIVVVGSPQIG